MDMLHNLALDVSTGYIMLSNIPILHIKIVWCYLIAGVGALASYLQHCLRNKIKFKIREGIIHFSLSIVSVYLVIGAISLVSDKIAQEPYIYFLVGYFNKAINDWIANNAERLVGSFMDTLIMFITKRDDRDKK